MARALESEPRSRYASGGAIADDLDRFLRGRFILSVVVVVVVVVPVTSWWRQRRRADLVAEGWALLDPLTRTSNTREQVERVVREASALGVEPALRSLQVESRQRWDHREIGL